MLTILMYHHLRESFEADLAWLLEHYHVIEPGAKIQKRSLLLTFDDGYKDVYTRLYPALKQHGIKAVLAIPTALIGSSEAYCNWEEIGEMVRSGHIIPASHSVHHPNMTEIDSVGEELEDSKRIIRERTGVVPEIFVYPYGAWSLGVQSEVEEHYKMAMRIGSALNRSWRPLLYRIDEARFLAKPKSKSYYWKYLMNRLRGQ